MPRTKLVALLAAALLLGGAAGAYAQDITGIIKTVGIGAAVRMFAPQINDFINRLLLSKDAETKATTKVVPILSISIGVGAPGRATIGAAQVAGPKNAVNRVQAVAALDANFAGVWQIRALIPVDGLEPWKSLRRVVGVGVSAIIDLRI
ncbi:MAG: hypothetical protein QN152_03525 [Armatimonadota bacterium]|nr:hypothetical protein [Armatimonadota bacterium]MDR7427031.1 hypothetical protein [Armatimonadota bacterium]MDR7538584.1 hypothetical protein [Armatimonadota bacterium]